MKKPTPANKTNQIDEELAAMNQIMQALKPLGNEEQTYTLAAAVLAYKLVDVEIARGVIQALKRNG